MPRLLELFCGTKSVGRAFEAAGWEVVSLDIVSKFEPTTTFPPHHFDMVWASPVCTEYSCVLMTRLRRLLEGDALVLSALEIIAHFDPLMWIVENPATGLLKTRPFMEPGGRDLLHVRDSVQEADPTVDQHALEAEARPVQARQPLRGVAGRQAPPRRAAGAAADGGAVREGQPITRAALQRPCCVVRGDCARGHGGACGAAEHSGLDHSGFV